MAKRRIEIWLMLGLGAVALFVTALMGLFAYVTATATPLHPAPERAPSVVRQAPAPAWIHAVERGRRAMRTALSQENLPGLSVAVGVRGEIVWAEGFGFADLEKRAPVTPEHRFRIGTASMVLTSAAVGLLLEQQRLALDREIQTWVPDFPKKKWPVTLRQVMAHVAGIANDGGDEGELLGRHCEQPLEGLQVFARRDLLFEPGTRLRESSYGWILVSAAIEAASGEPFLRFMRSRVFAPLGMEATRPDSDTEPMADRVTPYFPRFGADPSYGPDPMREVDYSCYAGASVFLSTPSDLVRFGMGMVDGRLLQPATLAQFTTSQRLVSGEETGYGLGWDRETVDLAGTRTVTVGHDGDILGGRVVSLITLPERGLVVAVASNTSYADTFALAARVAQGFAEPATRPAS